MTDRASLPEQDPWRFQLEALGAFLRSQRQMANLSLRQVAEMADISNAYVSQVERGMHDPSMRVLSALAGVFGLTVTEVFERAGVVPASGRGGGPSSVEDAIAADPSLSPEERRALLVVYRSMGVRDGTP